MAYLSRQDIIFDGSTFHITWQCHNGSWFLESDDAKQIYYDLLLKYKERYGVSFYSYCFMSSHPHLTGKITNVEGLSRLMQLVNSQFAKKINKTMNRRGQVIMDRYKSPVIQTDEQLLRVMAYVDLNPQRAKMVKHPKNYKWSSYNYYAYGKDDPLLTPAPSYLALGFTSEQRMFAYRNMVEEVMADYGLEKQNYSTTCCIGNPDWVAKRYKEIKQIQKAKRMAYLARQRKFRFSASPT